MFHVKRDIWSRVANHTGFALKDSQLQALESYMQWLLREALPAGGLGPAEENRLHNRHIGDSLVFAKPLQDPPPDLVDLGSGVGLPGIPLAIMFPETRVTLVDRSGRRVDLMRRVVRVLDLDNVEVMQGDLTTIEGKWHVVVSRATIPPADLHPHLGRLLVPQGMAAVGGSWSKPPSATGWETLEIPAEVLDRAVWLLIMRRE